MSLGRDLSRQQNMLKLLEVENGYTVSEASQGGRIWVFGFEPSTPTDAIPDRMKECRQQAYTFMDAWYSDKEDDL